MLRQVEEWMLPTEEKVPPRPLQPAAIAGFVGALLLFAIQLGMQTLARGGPPMGTLFATKILHLQSMTALLVGAFLFCVAGALWGVLYAAFVPKITILSGMAFGVLPWIVAMLIVLPIVGKSVFAGGDMKVVLGALLLNVLWGGFVAFLMPLLNQPRLTS